jgi:DNA-binding transcriptional regulator PaaX
MIGATSALTIGAIVAPKLTSYICRKLVRRTRNRLYFTEKRAVRQSLNRLRKIQLISWLEAGDGYVTITLTETGKKRLLRYKVDELSIKPLKKWDRMWRIVIFDIPESVKVARNALRDKFRVLGLHQLQKSVWIYPYPCKDEIDFISALYGVAKYLLYFETKKLENEEYLMNKFNLSD